jgi:hypothetical protein
METSLNWLERARLSLLPVVVCNHATPRQVAVSLGHSSAHPAPARPTWPPDSRSAPAKPGTGVLFATASEWVARLADAHHAGRLQDELTRLGRYPLLSSTKSATSPSNPKPPTCSSTRLQQIRTRQPDRHLQQSLRPLGRSLRRRRGRRRHDRPCPPRRSHRPRRRQLPTQRPRPRPRPRSRQHNRRLTNKPPGGQFSTGDKGSKFKRR